MIEEKGRIDVEGVRALFPALGNYVWFQNGGVSITPTPVAEEHARLMRELLERGPMHIVYPRARSAAAGAT